MVNYRNALERLWTDTCTVITRIKVTDPVSHTTSFQDVNLLTDAACKLSIESVTAAGDGDVATISQAAKLFLGDEVEIPAGASIIVTREGHSTRYRMAGFPARFHHHQEIALELEEKYP